MDHRENKGFGASCTSLRPRLCLVLATVSLRMSTKTKRASFQDRCEDESGCVQGHGAQKVPSAFL